MNLKPSKKLILTFCLISTVALFAQTPPAKKSGEQKPKAVVQTTKPDAKPASSTEATTAPKKEAETSTNKPGCCSKKKASCCKKTAE